MRLKINLTPDWWRTKTEDPRTWAAWFTKTAGIVRGTWRDAEIRFSSLKMLAVVTFSGEQTVRDIALQKIAIMDALNRIPEDEQPVSERWIQKGLNLKVSERVEKELVRPIADIPRYVPGPRHGHPIEEPKS